MADDQGRRDAFHLQTKMKFVCKYIKIHQTAGQSIVYRKRETGLSQGVYYQRQDRYD